MRRTNCLGLRCSEMLDETGCGSWLSSASFTSRGVLRPRQHRGGSQKYRTEELLAGTDNFASEKEVTIQTQL
jgi:hypothetical protein